MAHDAMRAAGIPVSIIRSSDIRNGILNDFNVLFVPGGWASNKMKSLGEEGAEEIRRFVREGGSYIGFCGGAGLATNDGLGLLEIERMPTKERVPSFSGRISLDISGRQIFSGVSDPVFSAWWPSQFLVKDEKIDVLARYGDALTDAFSSDLNVGDVSRFGSWETLEDVYRIRLDPARLKGEPAVVEGMYGNGRIVLSLVHFDTTGDANGQTVLKNIVEYLGTGESKTFDYKDADHNPICHSGLSGLLCDPLAAGTTPEDLVACQAMYSSAADLIGFGERNFLWFWRTPMLLQWRRGVRGLEYCTLYIMLKKINALLADGQTLENDQNISGLAELRGLFDQFVANAEQLLYLERQAMQGSRITYEHCEDDEIKKLRNLLFSASKSHGGLFKDVISRLDMLLFDLLSRP